MTAIVILARDVTEELAPVSGARCRYCGKRPWRDPEALWTIDCSTAFCDVCWDDLQQELAASLTKDRAAILPDSI